MSRDTLDALIKDGRLLQERISKHYEGEGVHSLPPEERISVAELEAWYKGVSNLLEQQFGTESADANMWRDGLARIRKASWEGVGSVSPTGGQWTIHNLVESLGLLGQIRLLQLGQPQSSDISLSLAKLLEDSGQATINRVYRDDFLASLKELRLCFSQSCYIACLALSGKILEICLKQVMLDNNIRFGEKWMIGQLLGALGESNHAKYLHQSLTDIANIINKSRIPAVHAKESVPVPSREQAAMVIHAVIDTVNRVIVNP